MSETKVAAAASEKKDETKTKKRGRKPKSNGVHTAKKGPDGKDIKRKHKRHPTYNTYLKDVLKELHPDVGISIKAMGVLNSMTCEVLDRTAAESARLHRLSKGVTLGTREIQTALRMLCSGVLARGAIQAGTKAVLEHRSSLGNEDALQKKASKKRASKKASKKGKEPKEANGAKESKSKKAKASKKKTSSKKTPSKKKAAAEATEDMDTEEGGAAEVLSMT